MTASTVTTPETVVSIEDILASAGMSISERKTLDKTIAPSVLKALADTKVSKVYLFVNGAQSSEAFMAQVATAPQVTTLRYLDVEYGSVRTHVLNAGKSRKVKLACSALKNADKETIAAIFSRA